MRRIPSLDGFRAISIILVLIAHNRLAVGFPKQYVEIARHGVLGVTIFFVISGFLITYLLLTEDAKNGTISLKRFYINRSLRILPVFMLYMIFIIIWGNFESTGVARLDILHVFTFTGNFYMKHAWATAHFWSLSVEEQFYVFWPAMLILFRKHLKIVLAILISCSCIIRVVIYKFPAYSTILLSPFFSYSDAIFIGALGGILFFEKPAICEHWIFRSYPAQAVAVCLIPAFVYFSAYGKLGLIALPFGNAIISASILFLILSYITPSNPVIFKFLNCRVMVHIGILSYSIYIWQQFFFVGQLKVFWRIFPYNLLVIYLVSLASYYLWEKPFLNMKNGISANKLQPVSD
jgi:peptidoglycan/LPS O-acetylase OafA/YrhL